MTHERQTHAPDRRRKERRAATGTLIPAARREATALAVMPLQSECRRQIGSWVADK